MPAPTTPIVIQSDQRSALPKISIKSVIAAIQNEELNELIPLYAVFLKRDTHLGSEMRKRRRQILGVTLMVESEDEPLKALIKGYLKAIDLYKLTFDMSIAIPYGFSITNMIYDNINIAGKAYFAPKSFMAVHPRYTEYDAKERKLYIKLTSGSKVEPQAQADQFLWHEHPEDTGELADYGVMSNVLLTCIMKHAVMNSNMQYFEILGVPPVYVNAEVQDDDEAKALLDQVMNLRSNSVGVFPKETLVNLLLGQSGRTEFLAFIQYCDQQISHNIMGNVLSGNATPNGTQALGTVHDGRRVDVLTYDCGMIERSLRKLVDIFLSLNYPKEQPEYELYFDTGDSKDEMRLAQIYQLLTSAGYRIPKEHIEEMFNIEGIEHIEPAAAEPAPAIDNIEASPTSTDTAAELPPAEAAAISMNGAQVTAMLEVITQVTQGLIPKTAAKAVIIAAFHIPSEQADEMLNFEVAPMAATPEQNSRQTAALETLPTKPIEDAILGETQKLFKNASSYQEALDALLEAYPNLDFDTAVNTLEKAVANSYIAERAK